MTPTESGSKRTGRLPRTLLLLAVAVLAALAAGSVALARATDRRAERQEHLDRNEVELRTSGDRVVDVRLHRSRADLDGATDVPLLPGGTWLRAVNYSLEALHAAGALWDPVHPVRT